MYTMASVVPNNNSTSFKKMIERFFDKQLVNEDRQNELIVLGESYSPSDVEELDSSKIDEGSVVDNNGWPEEFLKDVGSRIWLTYRTGFALIPKAIDGPSHITMSIGTFLRSGTLNDFKSGFTTDAGWGCMIRTSQSLLANALIILKLGREWRYLEGDKDHDTIVSWFIDIPLAPFSIHNFVIEGSKTGKNPGEWFGPTAASRSIHNLCNEKFVDCGLKVYLSEDGGDIYEDDFFKILNVDGEFKPMLILSALRLGVDNVNPIYWDSLKKTLSISQSVGIAGGREKSSHYFFGVQGDYLFYFDPHLPQESLQLDFKEEEFVDIETKFNFETVHTTKLRKIHLKEMDPSMLIGFLIKTQDDYYNWKQIMQQECKLIHFNNKKQQQQQQQLRKPSIVEFDDEGFIDLGFDEEEEEEVTEPMIMVEERRFSEPVMVDKDDLSANLTNSSQVFENLSS